jgi:superfamily II DNA/RNA helicase
MSFVRGLALSFTDLSLHPLVLKAIEASGYTVPTPIQAAAIPPAVAGRDLLATAETGTGKTAAFMLPALHRLASTLTPRRRGPRVLVLTPTRELAAQITKAARQYGKFLHLNTMEIVGGMPYRQQLQLMARPLDVVVATPGRLIDHLERRRIDLSEVELLILDEADRMLDMGFIEPVELIAAACPPTRQTLLFSATLNRGVAKVAAKLLRDPMRVEIARTLSAPDIEQRLHHVDDLAHKRRLLHHWAASDELSKGIVFAATKRDVDSLARELASAGFATAGLHGDMDQRERNRTLDRLRSGAVRLLVATDVAGRGLDVRDITHVINFDLPHSAEDYVHRIGRTGRAGKSGIAISFAGHADRGMLARIERFTGTPLPVHVVPGLEPTRPVRNAAPTHKRPFRRGAQRFAKPGEGKPYAGHRSNPGGRPAASRRTAEGQRRPG